MDNKPCQDQIYFPNELSLFPKVNFHSVVFFPSLNYWAWIVLFSPTPTPSLALFFERMVEYCICDNFQTILRSSSIPTSRSCLPFTKIMRLSSIHAYFMSSSCYINWGRLQFTNKLRLSSLYKQIEVVFHLQNKFMSSSIFQNELRSSSF